MSERDVVLGRIRAALADVQAAEAPAWSAREDADPAAAYIRVHELATDELVELFTERCRAYSANVTRCTDTPSVIAAAIAEACSRHGVMKLAIPATLAPTWRPQLPTVESDEPPMSVKRLDTCDAVLSGCAVAIALTGTIVLDGGAGQGRRVLTLVPDLHICVVRAHQIVAGIPEALAELAEAVDAGRALTFISGPSATSDIELERVEGVHGPRRLEVIVASNAGGVEIDRHAAGRAR